MHEGLSLCVQLALECVGALDRQLQIRKNCEQDARGVVGGLMSGPENVVCRVVCVQAYVPKTACKDNQYPPLFVERVHVSACVIHARGCTGM